VLDHNPDHVQVQWIDFEWVDLNRDRAVPARLHMPVLSNAEAKAPLVLFSHGLGGSRYGYSYFGRHLASRGIASLHVQHVGSDRGIWGGGSPLNLLKRIQAAAHEDEAQARALDVRFALDTFLQGSWRERIDAERIAVAGHSYGANTSLLLAGAALRRNGRAINLRDYRIQAAILLSAPPFFGEPSEAKIVAPITIPSVHITSTHDVIRIPGYHSGVDDRLAIFNDMGGTPKCLAVFQGGAHSVFTDRRSPGGYVENGAIKAATCGLAHSFLLAIFEDEGTLVDAWYARHRELLFHFELQTSSRSQG
jgi:pimeloyl-ACP methyl ester carboxylesterase